MPSYQIYIPNARGASPDRLKEVGLDVHDPQATVEAIEVFAHGPDSAQGGSGRGLCFFWVDQEHPEYNPTPGVRPDMQEWTPAKATGGLQAGRFWIGREKGQPIEPESLLRKGYETATGVELLDGQTWFIPAVRRLPHRFALDERGVAVRRVDPKYGAFYQQSVRYYNQFLQHQVGAEIEIAEAWPFAISALAMNYRVDANIVDWLGLLNDINILYVIGATFEWSTIQLVEAQKKKAAS